MPIERIRGIPIDKILSSRVPQQRLRAQREECSGEEAPDSDRTMPNDYIDCAIDVDLAMLPPPRRSLASRLNPRQLTYNRNLIMKWIICLSAVFIFLHFVPRFHTPQKVKLARSLAILLWNEESSRERGRHYQCHCAVTNERSYTAKAIDAVIVNADRPYSMEGLEKIARTPNFLMVFAAKQPLNLAQNPLSVHGESVFNYSMTYRLDSDLIWTDYYFSMAHNAIERLHKFEPPDKEFMTKMTDKAASHLRFKLQLKHRLAAYMMYEGNDSSIQQSRYLEQLRRHMDLSVIEKCHEINECIPYSFMLIVEPSRCPDYVNPQFYMALANFVVPVLLGGGNLSQLAPPGSYISGENYSPPELAQHLKTLSSRPQQYEEFFWWHSKYQIHEVKQPYCALCRQLRNARRQRQSLEFLQWWTVYQCPDPEALPIGIANIKTPH